MAILSLHSVSPCILREATKIRQPPKLLNPFIISQSSTLHHSLTSTTSLPLATQGPIKSLYSPISMSFQMEEAAMANPTPRGPELDPPTVISITIPPETLAGFEADYEKVSATWPADLATTTDDVKIEEFVSSADALVRRWFPQEVVSRLERYIHDPNQPPALVIRGLPIDRDLPPTEPDAYLKKAGKCMSETWLVGIARIVGQVFTFDFMRGSRTGMGLLVKEIYTSPDKVDQVGAEGSRELLDFHVDLYQVRPEYFPNVIAFIGIRGDRDKEGKTLLCDNRKLYRMLDPADIQVLRTQKITWSMMGRDFTEHVIEGSESNPKINVFEENLRTMGGFDKIVNGSPEAVAAYKRVKKVAAALAEGVWLDGGDVLLLNQKKASHGRSPYAAKYDGNDRWLQRTYSNSGGFWDTGIVQWPCRTVPY